MTTSTSSSSAQSRCSIFPPAPLDSPIQKAFPSVRESSLGIRPAPYARFSDFVYVFWIFLLAVFSHVSAIAPVVLLFLTDSPVWVRWLSVGVGAVALVFCFFTWIALLCYRPPKPIAAYSLPNNGEGAAPIDIIITTYNEHLDEIAGTLSAVNNIIWDGPVNVYVLDDASRDDVEELCGTIIRARYPVTRITRRGNKGKKAGNVNHWLNEVPRTADFFVTLDCDMRPFPNILQVLFGAYHAIPEVKRSRLAFIQTPQFFRNYDESRDLFDVCAMFFIKVTMQLMNTLDTVPFVGTGALWNRDAIERSGGFVEETATEDVVTACRVHTTRNENGDKYISKYVPVPVAAGLAPRTLAELMDQHTRWMIGQTQMTIDFRFFLFHKGLRPIQRIAYLSTLGGWTRDLPVFSFLFLGTISANLYSAVYSVHQNLWVPPLAVYIAMCLNLVIPLLATILIPGASIGAMLRSFQMYFVYMSTEFAGFLYVIGFPISYRYASETSSARWSPHFLFHLIIYTTVVLTGIIAIVMHAVAATKTVAPYVQTVLFIAAWTYVFFPLFRALLGYEAHEDTKWLALEEGRVDLFEEPVWSETKNVSIEQLKIAVSHLTKRLQIQDRYMRSMGSDIVEETLEPLSTTGS